MKSYLSINNISLQDGKSRLSLVLAVTLVLNIFLGIAVQNVHAAVEMSESYIRLDRLKAATATTSTICMKPSATHTTALDAVKVTWPSGFTVGAFGTWASTGSTLGGATAMPGIAAATASVSTQTVTWTFATDQTVTGGVMYCFAVTSSTSLTNASAGNDKSGTVELTDATPASSETSVYALSIVAEDQVTVDADVPATFTFTVPDTAIEHGALSTSTVDTDAATAMAVATNAENGWLVWMKADSTNSYGLYSASTADTISTTDADTLETAVAGTEDWIIDVASSGGTVVTEFDGNGTTTGGALPGDGTFEQIASSTTISSSDSVTLTSIAAISSTNKAASDYQETLTVVAAGNF